MKIVNKSSKRPDKVDENFMITTRSLVSFLNNFPGRRQVTPGYIMQKLRMIVFESFFQSCFDFRQTEWPLQALGYILHLFFFDASL